LGGRDAATATAIERFDAAFATRDVDRITAEMTDDRRFESTGPPDGRRHEGRAAVRRAWEDLSTESSDAAFETEEVVIADDRAFVRWRYRWSGTGGTQHVRRVDLFRVRDGSVAVKLSLVKP
jgi:ketosteroid isomerase-like protein